MEKSLSAVNKENHESPMLKCMCAHAGAAGQRSLGAGARLPWVPAKSVPPPPMDLGNAKKFLERILILGLFTQSSHLYSLLGSYLCAVCCCVGPLTSLGHLCPSQDEGLVKKKKFCVSHLQYRLSLKRIFQI